MPDINSKKLNQAINELVKYVTKNSTKKLIDAHCDLSLQINLKKIPHIKGFHRFFLDIPHAFYQDGKTCLFVKNLQQEEIDDDLEIHQWATIIKNEANISFSKIITFHQLKTEYKQYEAKRMLSNSCNLFFADNRLLQYMSPLLGKAFVDKKKWPIGVNIDSSRNLKSEIDKAFHRIYCTLSGKGTSCEITFGHTNMTTAHISENLSNLLAHLDSKIPGNTLNIQSLYLRLKDGSGPSLPLYISLDDPNLVPIPKISKPKLEIDDFEEITTVQGALVRVLPNGRIEFKKKSEEEGENNKVKNRVANPKKKQDTLKNDDTEVKLEDTYIISAPNESPLEINPEEGDKTVLIEQSVKPDKLNKRDPIIKDNAKKVQKKPVLRAIIDQTEMEPPVVSRPKRIKGNIVESIETSKKVHKTRAENAIDISKSGPGKKVEKELKVSKIRSGIPKVAHKDKIEEGEAKLKKVLDVPTKTSKKVVNKGKKSVPSPKDIKSSLTKTTLSKGLTKKKPVKNDTVALNGVENGIKIGKKTKSNQEKKTKA